MILRIFGRLNAFRIFAIFVVLSLILIVSFAPGKEAAPPSNAAALALPLSRTIPPGVVLRVGDPMTQWVFAHNGWDQELPFRVEWAEITGGPDVTEAFLADALDVGLAASIPPIHAVWMGIPVRIVAFREFADHAERQAYYFGIAPNANIKSLSDLRGKRIAFSPSQVQGQIVIQTLKALGIRKDEVTLVELPSNMGGDVYTNSLISNAVDAAPIRADIVTQRYLRDYGSNGADALKHPPFRDDGINLYVPEKVLADPDKAAALRIFVEYWGRAQAWVNENPDALARGYFVGNRGLPLADAQFMAEFSGNSSVPRTWETAIAYQQEAIDTMSPDSNQPHFNAETLFDRRFESVAGDAAARAQGKTP